MGEVLDLEADSIDDTKGEKYYRDTVLRRWRDGTWSRESVRVYCLLLAGFSRKEVADILLVPLSDIDKYLKHAGDATLNAENRAVANVAHQRGISLDHARALHRAADPAWYVNREEARVRLTKRMRFHNALLTQRKIREEIAGVKVESAEDIERLANAGLKLESGNSKGVVEAVGEAVVKPDSIRVELVKEFKGSG